jgi:hypothetical protein
VFLGLTVDLEDPTPHPTRCANPSTIALDTTYAALIWIGLTNQLRFAKSVTSSALDYKMIVVDSTIGTAQKHLELGFRKTARGSRFSLQAFEITGGNM